MENIPVIPYMCPELVAALMEIFAPKPVDKNCPPMKEKIQVAKTYQRTLEVMIVALPLASSALCFAAAENAYSPIQVETLVQSTSSWDGTPYKAYPAGQPQIAVLKITIPPHTTMKWHSHPMPSAGYILSGELTIERKDGAKKHFVAGQAVSETVDSIHRGITGAEPLVVIVFYPGTPGLPVSNSDH